MTQHDGGQPLTGPPAGWGPRPANPSPYAIPQQWLTNTPGDPVGARTYPMMWDSPGINRGRLVRVLIMGIVGFLVAGFAAGGLASVAYTLFVETGPAGVTQSGWYEGAILTSLVANAVVFAIVLPFTFQLSRNAGQEARWLHSVTGQVRWGWLMQCMAVGVVALIVFVGVMTMTQQRDDPGALALPLWLLPVMVVLLLVAAIGTEYLLRGAVNRGVASLISSPGIGIATGAVVSGLVPVVLSAPSFVYTKDFTGPFLLLGVGVMLSVLVWLTGGLEAAVATALITSLTVYIPLFVPGMQDVSQLGAGLPLALMRFGPAVLMAVVIVLLARLRGVDRFTEAGATARA